MKVSCASCHTLYATEECARCGTPSLRSLAPTLPRGGAGDVAFEAVARTVTDPRFAGETLDAPVSRVRKNRRRDWCVDFGARIDTMTTFQLWVAIANRDVGPDVRVWREGMECWAPIVALPELACAVRLEYADAGATGWERVPREPAAIRASSPGADPGPSEVVLESFASPKSEAPAATPTGGARVVAASELRRVDRLRHRPLALRRAHGVAAAAAVALLAIGVAAFASARPTNGMARKIEPSWSNVALAVTGSLAGGPLAEPDIDDAPSPEGLEAARAFLRDEPAARRDPGQHRLRQGQHAARRAAE